METWLIIVLALAGVLLLLAIGGAVATARRTRAQEPTLLAAVAEVNDALAAAHAEDMGWEPERLQAAATAAFGERHPGVEPESFQLVHVDDRPGIEQDRAIFKIVAAGVHHQVILGRVGDGWVPVES